MICVLMVITCISLNCNGLQDPSKWKRAWYPALSLGMDMIVFQETHLTVKQECAINICTQAFDKFYAHGTS